MVRWAGGGGGGSGSGPPSSTINIAPLPDYHFSGEVPGAGCTSSHSNITVRSYLSILDCHRYRGEGNGS